jgi:hypothetical protein
MDAGGKAKPGAFAEKGGMRGVLQLYSPHAYYPLTLTLSTPVTDFVLPPPSLESSRRERGE